jgi:GNAT superfamily N-acetyltransferase
MTLRRAAIEDLPALSECAREFYASSDVLKEFNISRFCETWTGFLNSGMGVIFILCEGAEIRGTISGVAYMEPYSYAMIAQEFWWYVLKDSRGAGIRLYRAFEQWARERGCSVLRMGHLVDSMPEKVGHFYERIGLHREEVVYSKALVA